MSALMFNKSYVKLFKLFCFWYSFYALTRKLRDFLFKFDGPTPTPLSTPKTWIYVTYYIEKKSLPRTKTAIELYLFFVL